MWVLIIVLTSFGLVVFLLTYFNRKNKTEDTEIKVEFSEECCGAHEVCDKDSLLNSDVEIEYFDDEELDKLSHIAPEKLTDEQVKLLSEVFYTLKESDVAPWLRSLQLRAIQLPLELREQALLIVSERRA